MVEISKYRDQDIFDLYEDYISYFKKTYSLFQDLKQSQGPSFPGIISEYLKKELEDDLSFMAQDLKAPMLEIQSICARSSSGDLPPKSTAKARCLHYEACEINQNIDRMLKTIKLKYIKSLKISIDISEIIENIIQDSSFCAQKKKITIQRQLDPISMIGVDGVLFYEAMAEVILSAIKSSPMGGYILIKTQRIQGEVRIEFIKKGTHIGLEECNRAFKEFRKSSKCQSLEKRSGLGLYFARCFIELHGGRVIARSLKNHGNQVQVYFPTHNWLSS